ncbi:MAG TPA: F0F1 ATP synthase subunit alpha, partial [Rhodopila sp.]|nr:F0F1 ATP synthase subunit alpha [Rhodopila sp.]
MTSLSPWLERAVDRVTGTRLGPSIETWGRVQAVADGIAIVSGLASVRLDEVLRFQRGQLGFAHTLERDLIGCVLLDDAGSICAGDEVRGSGEVVRTLTGPGLLGRVVDPLGRPLDGGPPVVVGAPRPIDAPAPAIVERDLVTQPVQTGILTIDALFPLGRGQRELIIGDRGTGKTAVAVDTIINQR